MLLQRFSSKPLSLSINHLFFQRALTVFMEFLIRNVQFSAAECDVTKAIAEVLHACPGPFVSDDEVNQRRINFEVALEKNDCGGVRNNGRGSLRLPSKDVGLKFRRLVDGEDGVTIKVGGKRLKFIPTTKHIPPYTLAALQKAPYVNPDIAQERQQKIDALSSDFRIDKLQIGVLSMFLYTLRIRIL